MTLVPRAGDRAQVMATRRRRAEGAQSSGEASARSARRCSSSSTACRSSRSCAQEDDFSFSMSERRRAPIPARSSTSSSPRAARYGIHLLASVDTLQQRQPLHEPQGAHANLQMRVVFQMSANDSASLIDSPQASNLGLHRALFYNEHQGSWKPSAPTPCRMSPGSPRPSSASPAPPGTARAAASRSRP